MKLVAKTLFGIEEVLSKELTELGAQNVSIKKRAVEFEGDIALLYKCCYKLKTALRILMPIHSFSFKSKKDYYNFVYRFNWSKFLSPDQSLAIQAVCHSRFFNHSKYLAQFTKDGIVDHLRKKFGKRPSVDIVNPDISIHVMVHEDKAEISLDASGFSLHKRSYRQEKVSAPMNEALASGILQLSGWDKKTTILDPMCGSGTLIFEAAILAMDIPMHLNKTFCFQRWPNYDQDIHEIIKQKVKMEVKEQSCDLYASDRTFRAVEAFKKNAEAFPNVTFNIKKDDFFQIKNHPAQFLIMNPPYDLRMRSKDILDFYKRIGDALKQNWKPCEAWIFSGNIDAIKSIGLKTSRKINLMNGQLPSKLHKFEVYEGSRRHK